MSNLGEMLYRRFLSAGILFLACVSATVLCQDEGWILDSPSEDFCVLRNEQENWEGIRTGAVLPMCSPKIVVRKCFDMSRIPLDFRRGAGYASLRMHIGILDYSLTKPTGRNGLTETFRLTINGHVLDLKTSDDRFPRTYDPKKKRAHHWMDFEFPVEWLRGAAVTEVTIGKTMGGDDFIYPSVDQTVPTTASSVSYDGGRTYQNHWLDSAGRGEFMMRLLVGRKRTRTVARYEFDSGRKTDSRKILSYIAVQPDYAEFELFQNRMDFSQPVLVSVDYSGENSLSVHLQAPDGAAGWHLPMKQTGPGRLEGVIVNQDIPCRMMLNHGRNMRLKAAELSFIPSFVENRKTVNMNPRMADPAGERFTSENGCVISGKMIRLGTPEIRMILDLSDGIRLVSVDCARIGRNIVRQKDRTGIFKIRTADGSIYTGAEAREIRPEPVSGGVKIYFSLPAAQLTGILVCRIDGGEIRMTLSLKNISRGINQVTTVFPHLDGLVLSERAEDDYYLFPWGGGIIADRNTMLRTTYGANEAWYQLIDLFSPKRGGGFYLRIDDGDIIFKGFNLRKNENSLLKYRVLSKNRPGKNDLSCQFTDSLTAGMGIGMSVDYQRDEFKAGECRGYPPAVFGAHAGNWKIPMKIYADWAHKTWHFRPVSRKLANKWNLDAGKSLSVPLYNGKEYNPKFVGRKYSEIIEMICYWTASERAPWNTPMDRMAELGAMGERAAKKKFGYWFDSVLKKKVYSLNRGDYNGYNPHWGGLPALRRYIQDFQKHGQTLILYTDPLIVCGNSSLGKNRGAEWGVINPNWKDPFGCPKNPTQPEGIACNYFSYCMCLNDRNYSDWVAKDMARLVRETGADGIRLDEYGHIGYICLSEKHDHIFPGKGKNVWLQALDYNLKAMRREMDLFKPDALILAEYPGTDGLAANLSGALCYDISNRTNELRPLAVNLFRFYFPECKLFELNFYGRPRDIAQDYWLFNAVGVYNSGLYSEKYRQLLNQYSAAFNGKAEPLVNTLVPYVYANRFEAPDGTVVFTLMNQSGHTVKEPLLRVRNSPEFHFVDLITGQKLSLFDRKGEYVSVGGEIRNNKLLVIGKVRKK